MGTPRSTGLTETHEWGQHEGRPGSQQEAPPEQHDEQGAVATATKPSRKERRAQRKQQAEPQEPQERRGRVKKAAAVVGDGANRIRTLIARIIWAVAVVLALTLATGALLIALDANRSNEAVRFVLRSANTVDLGIFARNDGIKTFDGSNADLKNALFNWGLGTVAWLVIGKVLDKIVRPARSRRSLAGGHPGPFGRV